MGWQVRWLAISSVVFFAAIAGAVVFQQGTLTISGKTIKIEIAETNAERSQGLMFRKKLPSGTGMLFIFEKEKPLSFWMKDTFIPLSIGFFDKDKRLVDVQDMAPAVSQIQKDFPNYTSAKPAMYALEVPKGWFKAAKVRIGERFSFRRK